MTLERARHVEHGVGIEVLAMVVHHVGAARIEVLPSLLVRLIERVAVPAIPELSREVHELGSAFVALAMIQRILDAKALDRTVLERGDDVPADPAVAQVVQ
ncbi:MAG: hypothetical protein QM778_30690 [Myxococcales bacterium]